VSRVKHFHIKDAYFSWTCFNIVVLFKLA